MEYFELARKYVEERFGADADEQTKDVLIRWEDTLNRLENDPMSLSGELDWIAKKELMEGYRRRDSLDWDAARLHLVDLQYADVRPEKGLYNRLAARGKMKRLLDEPDVGAGRGRSRRRTPARTSAAAAWSSTRTTSPRPPGTRSSSICRAVTRCSGCRPWNRCAARVTTSRSSWTGAARRKTWSGCCPGG